MRLPCVTNCTSFQLLPIAKSLTIRLFVPFPKKCKHFSGALNKKGGMSSALDYFCLVQVVGLEPTRSCPLRILSPVRLPFRHTWSVWRYHPDLNRGIKVLQTFALPLGDGTIKNKTLEVIFKNATNFLTLLSLSFFVFAFSRFCFPFWDGAEDEIRTRDICLGKATLYH